MTRRHDGDCQIFRGKVCTCGYLHRLRPASSKWTEEDMREMAMQDWIAEVLFKLSDRLQLPPERTDEEVEALMNDLEKTWVEMGGTIDPKTE